MSADILVDEELTVQGYNRYSYVKNNPLSSTDPSGYLTIKEYEEWIEKLQKLKDQQRTAFEKENGKFASLNPFKHGEFRSQQAQLGQMIDVCNARISGIKFTAFIHNEMVDTLAAVTGTDAENASKVKVDVSKLDDGTAEYKQISKAASEITEVAADLVLEYTGIGVLKFLSEGKNLSKVAYKNANVLKFPERGEIREFASLGKAGELFPTNASARLAAERLGFSPVHNAPFNSHGQQVFKKGNIFITRDVDSHSGGAFKMFDRRGNRLGTYNEDLTIRIGD